MSLTSLISNKDVKERFRKEFQKPKFYEKRDLLAPPFTKRYGLVGTAFDYLLRFYLKYLNPDAVTNEWIAEKTLSSISSPILENIAVDLKLGKVVEFTETDLTRKVREIIKKTKMVYSDFLKTGNITDEMIECSLLLAQLDPIYRSGFVSENIGIVYEDDIADLRKLISIVDPDTFMAKKLCLLNPAFGDGSKLVGGADVDLFIDDMIIEVKTTKKFEFQRQYFNQLIGYYTLHEISGIAEIQPKPKVTKLAIYYSRYAYLFVFDVEEIIDRHNFPDFIHWFNDRANEVMKRPGIFVHE